MSFLSTRYATNNFFFSHNLKIFHSHNLKVFSHTTKFFSSSAKSFCTRATFLKLLIFSLTLEMDFVKGMKFSIETLFYVKKLLILESEISENSENTVNQN